MGVPLITVLFAITFLSIKTIPVYGMDFDGPESTGTTVFVGEYVDVKRFEDEKFRTRYHDDFKESSDKNIAQASAAVIQFQNELNGYHSEKDIIDSICIWVDRQFKYDIDNQLIGMSDALVDGRGVCWHYTYLFDALAKSYGFESEVLYGFNGKGVAHVWNRLLYGGQWYYFDLTYSDKMGGCLWMTEEEAQKTIEYQEYEVQEEG